MPRATEAPTLVPDPQDRAFPYDVAFSFVAEDEELASELDGLLAGRLRTFLYSRRQEVVAGTDGEVTFNRVFGAESRAVVVLHRPHWGDTPFTRIEATAIRNRAFEHGYDFCLFVPVGQATLPPWVPKNRIWIGLDRWGPQGAATVIEARVQELGGSPQSESPTEQALRLKRDLEAEQARVGFLESDQAVKAALAEFNSVGTIVQGTVTALRDKDAMDIAFDQRGQTLVVRLDGMTVSLDWQYRFANTLHQSRLILKSWEGFVSLQGRNFAYEPKQLGSDEFDFDIERGQTRGWRERGGRKRFMTSTALSDHLLEKLFELVRRRRGI